MRVSPIPPFTPYPDQNPGCYHGLRMLMRWLLLFLPALAFAASPDFRLERTPVSGGAELLTIFATVPARPQSFASTSP